MTVDEARGVVLENLKYQPGAFYGSAQGLALGAGMFFSNLRQPAFDPDRRLYRTVRGLAYVVTHECDVSQANNRPFNDSVLICPLIRFERFVEEFQGMSNLGAFLGELATRDVFRAVYVPTLADAQYGAILYLNRITTTHVSAFEEEGVECVGAVSATGLREIDAALSNLLMRQKADRLWGMR
jgi:hypothetical protein